MTVIYLIGGLMLCGGLFWVLTQITARQRRLNSELTRLERLAAEVAMTAEAVLERVDERVLRLEEMAAKLEREMAVAPAPAAAPAPVASPALTDAPAARYAEMQETVRRMAEQGHSPAEIAAAVKLPRGEIILMLNLRRDRGIA